MNKLVDEVKNKIKYIDILVWLLEKRIQKLEDEISKLEEKKKGGDADE